MIASFLKYPPLSSVTLKAAVVTWSAWPSGNLAVKIIDNSDITVRIQFIVGGTLFFCGFPSSPMVDIVLSSTCGPQAHSYGHNPKRLYLFVYNSEIQSFFFFTRSVWMSKSLISCYFYFLKQLLVSADTIFFF